MTNPPPDFPDPTPRGRLVEALRTDLLGPSAADEVLTQSPATRYLVGMLAPTGALPDPAEDESIETDGGDEAEEDKGPVVGTLDASSIGLSFVVTDGCDEVVIRCEWGEYTKVETGEASEPQEAPTLDVDADPGETAAKKQPVYEWHRRQHSVPHLVPLEQPDRLQTHDLADGVRLDWISRQLGGSRVVSVFLSNTRTAPRDRRPPDELWVYQPSITVEAPGSGFLARRLPGGPESDADMASADLVYRTKLEFATGHGVAAGWRISDDDPSRADQVWTEVIPDTRLPITSPEIEGVPQITMASLADADGEGMVRLLTPLADAYAEWIQDRRADAAVLEPPHRQVGLDQMDLAEICLNRIREGIALLEGDPVALKSFRFANAAMREQLQRTAAVRARRRGEEPPPPGEPAWRPFQIGFILQCLSGLADPVHDDRGLADLLWFPTGGGKTEAYLGLTAFTLAHRRLSPAPTAYETGAGTVVLMRYTLRLLTIQQFQRALALLCACETLRHTDPGTYGDERFTIGLWVGHTATPNSHADSADALAKLKDGRRVYSASPYQVTYCPWCGASIEPEHYVTDADRERTLITCPNLQCAFSAGNSEFGLPVLVVDEEIYRNPPSLLLATVDKFAQMPWNGRIQALFGRVERKCERHGFITSAETHSAKHRATKGWAATTVQAVPKRLAPPELVIQDELHLISGPLGTLAGLYEVAVGELCSRTVDGREVLPKVIASTATIRRADRQIQALFGRDAAVFPPVGLTAGESFFATTPSDSRLDRQYVGVYAPGKSVKTALVRTYACLLSRALHEFERDRTPETDAYMTLVGYFNSLRELGGAVRLAEDDVPARLKVLRRRGFGPGRLLFELKELTSRVNSAEIPERLLELDRTFLAKEAGAYPIDVLLASNMLSVGVDIDRLGLMVVSGQPKATAEYIQATSRVGRKHPGVVVVVYNWSRPRDTSHYERFRHFHETFYRHVEATSVTPFSARARDRALPAVLVSYLRLEDEGRSAESAADDFDPTNPAVGRLIETLRERAADCTGRHEVGVETEEQLKNLVGEWQALANGETPLVYTVRGIGGGVKANLLGPMEQPGRPGLWRAAGSLREVESEIDIVLTDSESFT